MNQWDKALPKYAPQDNYFVLYSMYYSCETVQYILDKMQEFLQCILEYY